MIDIEVYKIEMEKIRNTIKNDDNRECFKCIEENDIYKIKKHDYNSFDCILDIGSNVGVFSILSRTLFPSSKIITMEPCKKTFQMLSKNISDCNITNIILVNKAYGNGNPLFFKPREGNEHSTNDMFVEKNTENTYQIESINFSDIIETYKLDLDKKYLVKMNCEGGEKFLLEDKSSLSFLKRCKQFSLHVHFKCNKSYSDSWIEWECYNEWINDNFSKTHSIEYYKSSKKKGGGYYCIVEK